MAARRRARFVALTQLLNRQYPDLADAVAAIVGGRVVVDGATITNPNARVRGDASVRVIGPRRLRGAAKLEAALDAFGLDVRGAVAVDVGAAAGGFTSVVLDRGAARVYAVDVGFGQLAGRLRADQRVVNLERTNVAELDGGLVSDVVDLVTIDLSYLALADAVGDLSRLDFAHDAVMIALVKPTFELRSASLVTSDSAVRQAVQIAIDAIEASGWQAFAATLPRTTGARGAIEVFVAANRAELNDG